MGILPLEVKNGLTRKTLNLAGDEVIDILGISGDIKPGMNMKAVIHRADKSNVEVDLHCRIDTVNEVEYYRNGGILQYVLRNMLKNPA